MLGIVNAAGLVVTTSADSIADDGKTSLREAIMVANMGTGGNTRVISFDMTQVGPTIDLTWQLPPLVKNIYVAGPGASNLTVRRDAAGGDFRLFQVSTGSASVIAGLTLKNGKVEEDSGGAIFSEGALVVTGCAVVQNTAMHGGGIAARAAGTALASLTVYDTTFTGNEATTGGGISVVSAGLFVSNCAFVLNQAALTGGGIAITSLWATRLSAMLSNVSVEGNLAGVRGGGIFSEGILTLTGGTDIHNNVVSAATGQGGGVYVAADSTITFAGVRIGNNDASAGDGVLLDMGARRFLDPGGIEYYGGDGERDIV